MRTLSVGRRPLNTRSRNRVPMLWNARSSGIFAPDVRCSKSPNHIPSGYEGRAACSRRAMRTSSSAEKIGSVTPCAARTGTGRSVPARRRAKYSSWKYALRSSLAGTRPEPFEPDGLVAPDPAAPTISRRGGSG